ncbi:MAG: sugar transferase [Hyphomicrobiales bacterium]|nr:sugar transferase [Hyphomicrobiales bacterium]
MRFSRTPASLAHYGRQVSLLDIVLGFAAPLLAAALRDVYYLTRTDPVDIALYVAVATASTVAAAAYFRIGQVATRFLSRYDVLQTLKAAAAASVLTAAVVFSVARLDAAPRSLPALHFLVLGALLLGSRALGQARVRSRDAGPVDGPSENVVIVGANDLAALYIRMMDCVPSPRPRVLALLDDDHTLHGRSVCGRIVAGGLEATQAMVAEYATHGVVVNRIVIAYVDELSRRRAMGALRGFCESQGVVIEYLISRLGLSGRPAGGSSPEGAPQESLARGPGPGGALTSERVTTDHGPVAWSRRSAYWRARRAVDVVGAGLAMLLFAPAFCLIALVVFVDVGAPVVFWQERVGYLGRRINVHKFRTLRNPVGRAGRVLPDRERLSGVGRFLRASRLDELPQLYDILFGEMTIIGPRPLLPVDLPRGETRRHLVPPGLTGWAQVNGGKLVTAEEKSALDEWYVRNASLRVDLRILRLTALAPFRGDRRRRRSLELALQERAALNAEAPKRPALVAVESGERAPRATNGRDSLISSA